MNRNLLKTVKSDKNIWKMLLLETEANPFIYLKLYTHKHIYKQYIFSVHFPPCWFNYM